MDDPVVDIRGHLFWGTGGGVTKERDYSSYTTILPTSDGRASATPRLRLTISLGAGDPTWRGMYVFHRAGAYQVVSAGSYLVGIRPQDVSKWTDISICIPSIHASLFSFSLTMPVRICCYESSTLAYYLLGRWYARRAARADRPSSGETFLNRSQRLCALCFCWALDAERLIRTCPPGMETVICWCLLHNASESFRYARR